MRPLLYVHGFASSGHSTKARVLKEHFPEVFAPSLPPIPRLAVETLETVIAALGREPLLVGSSLGGFFALHLSAKHGMPAVLVNPVVSIEPTLTRLVGLNRSYYDGSRFETTEQHLRDLAAMAPTALEPHRLLALLQLGDEVIDQQRTLKLLDGARIIAEAGGCHAFDHFERHLAAIRRFADSAT